MYAVLRVSAALIPEQQLPSGAPTKGKLSSCIVPESTMRDLSKTLPYCSAVFVMSRLPPSSATTHEAPLILKVGC